MPLSVPPTKHTHVSHVTVYLGTQVLYSSLTMHACVCAPMCSAEYNTSWFTFLLLIKKINKINIWENRHLCVRCIDYHLNKISIKKNSHEYTAYGDEQDVQIQFMRIAQTEKKVHFLTSTCLKRSTITLLSLSSSTSLSLIFFSSVWSCVFIRSRSSLFTSKFRISKRIWVLSFSSSMLSASRNWFLWKEEKNNSLK